MVEALSQEELESLLRGMESELTPQNGGERLNACQQLCCRDEDSHDSFYRPERLGTEQMRALQTLHEDFCRNFSEALSALLRTAVEVKLSGIDQLTYNEFVCGLDNPTYFNSIKAEPLEGPLVLDINTSLLYPIIDRLLGGSREMSPPLQRPLTEIELRLVGRITDLFLKEIRRAWETVLPLELSVERVESNPQLAHFVPPHEVVVLVRFGLRLGETRGRINWCLPQSAMKRIGSQLRTIGKDRSATTGTLHGLNDLQDGAIVEVVVELAKTNLSTADLIALQVGDVIATEQDVRQPLAVVIEGRPKFHATPGAYKGHKAIRVVAPIEERHITAPGN